MSAPRRTAAPPPSNRGFLFHPGWVKAADRAEIRAWLETITPLWEQRFSTRRAPPPGEVQRPLLRPVYWLGNWQFACLGYYEPPRIADCAVAAEPFPPVLARLVREVESRVKRSFLPADVPKGWRLNTCLVNFYGSRVGANGVEEDRARVGEHRDFEPGPVASLSIGERALFQFVPRGRGAAPVRTMWLAEGDLQVFAGPLWKDTLLHRVQRVEDRDRLDLPPKIDGFRTRRVNFTFRYVPDAHVVPFGKLAPTAKEDVREYVETLARGSAFFAAALG